MIPIQVLVFGVIIFPAMSEDVSFMRNYTTWYIDAMVAQGVFTAGADPGKPSAYSPPMFYERDFAYLVEFAGELFEERGAVELAKKSTIFALGTPPARTNQSDEAPFRAKLLVDVSWAAKSGGDGDFFCAHVSTVLAQLNRTYLDPQTFRQGLVYSFGASVGATYGFMDSVDLKGRAFFLSLLHIDALQQIRYWSSRWSCENVPFWDIEVVESRLLEAVQGRALWNDKEGMWFPAENCPDLIDVWGSAFAVYIGAASLSQQERVLQWFRLNADRVFQAGQLRHLPVGTYWPAAVEIFQGNGAFNMYQNGGYWATPAAFVLPVMAKANSSLALQLLREIIEDAKSGGLNEWVNYDYCGSCQGAATFGVPGLPPFPTSGVLRGTKHYGASIASVWRAAYQEGGARAAMQRQRGKFVPESYII